MIEVYKILNGFSKFQTNHQIGMRVGVQMTVGISALSVQT
jgi:hypothetical protein